MSGTRIFGQRARLRIDIDAPDVSRGERQQGTTTGAAERAGPKATCRTLEDLAEEYTAAAGRIEYGRVGVDGPPVKPA